MNSVSRREFVKLGVGAVIGAIGSDTLGSPPALAATVDRTNRTTGALGSIPSGGGALKGIGDKFRADLFTGTGNYTIPLDIPAGRNGFQPELTLSYSTGNGNSAFGLGWKLGIPRITRKTSRGIPIYDDAVDTFVLSGVEDLVPVSQSGNTTSYRARTESSFTRIAHIVDATRQDDYWEVRHRDGTKSFYGTPRPPNSTATTQDEAVVADPRSAGHAFEWRVTETRDSYGNLVRFAYTRDSVREDGPHLWDQTYLSDISYADYGSTTAPSFLVQIKFHYGPRPDPFSECRSGFEIRTVQRCTRIEVWINESSPRLVRAYSLKYTDSASSQSIVSNDASLLTEISAEGYDDITGDKEQLPPLTFKYGSFQPEAKRVTRVECPEPPPVSLASVNYELVDLSGNGLPDIVELTDIQVRYWKNLGNGAFQAPAMMEKAPHGYALSDSGVQLVDADGDGRTDLLVSRREVAGFFPLSFEAGGWDKASFHQWKAAPSFNLENPELRLVDLNGDGVTDAIRVGDSIECFFNDPRRGWYDASAVRRPDTFPDISVSNPYSRLADMTGDGLADVVTIYDGQIEYWPCLGHGRFGAKVVMANSPQFGYAHDPRRILLGDIDGDGAADCVYVDDGKITLWINSSGNRWSERIEIHGTPNITDIDSVRFVDLLGNGVPGLLWTRDFELGGVSMFFLDLIGGRKPYLLEQVDNRIGAITKIGYSPSTRFYVADRAAGLKWETPLPFPVHVVSRVESLDSVSSTKLTTEYKYHHGYWDGVEHEFRGFGRVDEFDTETFDEYHSAGLHPSDRTFIKVDQASFSPPLESRTWFHLGAFGSEFGDWRTINYSLEFWPGDPSFFAAPPMSAANLSRRDQRDAMRALRGRVVRTELYARDGTDWTNRPYTVTERMHGVRLEVESRIDRPAIFYPYDVGERVSQWERGNDPMTTLTFKGIYDAYGQPRVQAHLAVPRGRDYRVRTTSATDDFLATYTVTTFAQRDTPTTYLVDRIARRATYAIENDGRIQDADPRPSAVDMWNALLASTSGAAIVPRQKLIGLTVQYYDGTDFDGLPLTQVGDVGALKRVEELVLTQDILRDGYRSASTVLSPAEEPPYLIPSTQPQWTADYSPQFQSILLLGKPSTNGGVAALGGYVFHSGDALRPAGFYAVTSQKAYNNRGLLTNEKDTFGNVTVTAYGDSYEILPTKVIRPGGQETSTTYDYRVFKASTVTDPNGNTTSYQYTPLGLLKSVAVRGKTQADGDATRPSVQLAYSFSPPSGQPIYIHTKQYVHHDSDSDDSGDAIEWRQYCDGFGRIVQTRILAEDVLFGGTTFGEGVLSPVSGQDALFSGTPRSTGQTNVVVKDWQRFDNKGRVIETYQAFFSLGWDFQPPTTSQVGHKTINVYDALGRIVRTVHPNGGEELIVMGTPRDLSIPSAFEPSPWETFFYDTNDNAGRTPAADPNSAQYSGHWNTPRSVVFDALGRTVVQWQRNGTTAVDWYTIRQEYDTKGNLTKTWDQLGRPVLQQVFDLSGKIIRTEHKDTGIIRVVRDAAGNVIERRNSNGALELHAYDSLYRLTRQWARDRSNEPMDLREVFIYGDSLDSRLQSSEVQLKNLSGRLYKRYDESGLCQFDQYDFKGNPLEKRTQVISTNAVLSIFTGAASQNWTILPFRVNWQPTASETFDVHASQLLDPTVYVTSQRYDALNRLKWKDYPVSVNGQRARLQPQFNRAGLLDRLLFNGDVIVSRVVYNAEGQRTLIAYGDPDPTKAGPRIMARYAYDANTSRLVRLKVNDFSLASAMQYAPGSSTLQDLSFGYDLVGNMVSSRDARLAMPFDVRLFTYDPLYRLLSSTGMECDVAPSTIWSPEPRCEDLSRSRAYKETYQYNASGSLTVLSHAALSGNAGAAVPTRSYIPTTDSNSLSVMRLGSNITYSYSYDGAGNIIRENAERSLTWNHANSLQSFCIQTSGAEPSVHATYLYDSTGQRVKKVVRTQGGRIEATTYIDECFERTELRTLGSTYQYDVVHASDGISRSATFRVGVDPNDSTPPMKFYVGNKIGGCTLVVDQSGSWISREEFTAYGETSFGSFAKKRFRFSRRDRDEESGLNYHGLRYYAPWLCRWMSGDPVGPKDSLNLYEFARSNPIAFSDSSGGQSTPEDDAANATVPNGMTQAPGPDAVSENTNEQEPTTRTVTLEESGTTNDGYVNVGVRAAEVMTDWKDNDNVNYQFGGVRGTNTTNAKGQSVYRVGGWGIPGVNGLRDCTGASFEAFGKALGWTLGNESIANSSKSDFISTYQHWLLQGEAYPDGVNTAGGSVDAIKMMGVGIEVSATELRPGDIYQFHDGVGGGHSAFVKDVTYDRDGKIVGFTSISANIPAGTPAIKIESHTGKDLQNHLQNSTFGRFTIQVQRGNAAMQRSAL